MKKLLVYLEGDKIFYENGAYLGDVFALEDGFKYFWPNTEGRGGAWSAHAMRAIADLLDEMNAQWEAELAKAFSEVKG